MGGGFQDLGFGQGFIRQDPFFLLELCMSVYSGIRLPFQGQRGTDTGRNLKRVKRFGDIVMSPSIERCFQVFRVGSGGCDRGVAM